MCNEAPGTRQLLSLCSRPLSPFLASSSFHLPPSPFLSISLFLSSSLFLSLNSFSLFHLSCSVSLLLAYPRAHTHTCARVVILWISSGRLAPPFEFLTRFSSQISRLWLTVPRIISDKTCSVSSLFSRERRLNKFILINAHEI